jgi:hypothetical protein
MNVLYCIILWCVSILALLCLLFIRHVIRDWLRNGNREAILRRDFRAARKNIA